MQAITNDASPERGRLLPSQVAIYAAIAIGTVIALWPPLSTAWHQTVAQVQKNKVAATPAGGSRSDQKESLADEVQAAAGRWQKDGFSWTLRDAPAVIYDEVLPVDMIDLETADLAPYRKAATSNWQGLETLPTLTGTYQRGRVATSTWPQPGSAAIELIPAMSTDPDRPASPWRVVLLFASTKDATTHARQAVADAGDRSNEQIKLGRAAQTTLAVPMDRQIVAGKVPYYCICPTGGTLQIDGVRLTQGTQADNAGTDPAAKRYAAWRDSYNVFVATVRERDRTATTPEQHQQIKNDVLAWKAANPEPPRPAANGANAKAQPTALDE